MRVTDKPKYRLSEAGRRPVAGTLPRETKPIHSQARKPVTLPALTILGTAIDRGDAWFGDGMNKTARALGLVPESFGGRNLESA